MIIMPKPKDNKVQSIPNRHLYSRVSYLAQAATYVEEAHISSRNLPKQATEIVKDSNVVAEPKNDLLACSKPALQDGAPLKREPASSQGGLPLNTQRYLITQLRAVASKCQIRLSRQFKRTICKRCNALLDDKTSSKRIENKSKGGRKPWADVYVIKCLSCASEKRFTVGAKRQVSKANRLRANEPVTQGTESVENAA